jgi:signal transduction histidine kinase
MVGSVMIMEDTTEKKVMERSRDEFFSIASHELRTPLTAIRGNADMILEYYKEQLKDPSLKEMVSDMHNSSVRLITIVNDFLDTSRLEQGKIEFKTAPFDVVQLVRDTLREYDVTGSRRKLSLELAEVKGSLPLVMADRDRTRQILINLIGNAVKFTEKGGVTISLEPSDKKMKISVTDTGKGIPVESQHLLFHKFQQAASSILTRDDTRGTGLGLYISRLLAEGMAGSLELGHSEAGKGSTFVVELPSAPEKDVAKTD